MKLSNTFTVDRPVDEVYQAFQDIERIATCMPGSTLLGQSAPGTYDGEVKVKVGPLSVAYSGTFTIVEANESARRLTMRARGREKQGAGNADAHIVATLSETDAGTQVDIDTDLSIRGKVAQFGRGVIGEVTDSIMQTFAGNVEKLLTARGIPSPAVADKTAPATAERVAPAPDAPSRPIPTAASAALLATQPREGEELDAWQLIVKPMVSKHAGSIVIIALSGLAAFLGARVGARSALRKLPDNPHR